MAAYTLKARNNHTLNWGGREYRDGDPINLSKADAERIAMQSAAYRFVPKGDGDEISMASIDADTAPPPVMPAPPEPRKP